MSKSYSVNVTAVIDSATADRLERVRGDRSFSKTIRDAILRALPVLELEHAQAVASQPKPQPPEAA